MSFLLHQGDWAGEGSGPPISELTCIRPPASSTQCPLAGSPILETTPAPWGILSDQPSPLFSWNLPTTPCYRHGLQARSLFFLKQHSGPEPHNICLLPAPLPSPCTWLLPLSPQSSADLRSPTPSKERRPHRFITWETSLTRGGPNTAIPFIYAHFTPVTWAAVGSPSWLLEVLWPSLWASLPWQAPMPMMLRHSNPYLRHPPNSIWSSAESTNMWEFWGQQRSLLKYRFDVQNTTLFSKINFYLMENNMVTT